ncbi:MAG: ABC transporter ATP-binding protein/permease [Clostridia bacterium]|nr:ABC transporter ATP-binding protein/permease [Clostridia bacterium]
MKSFELRKKNWALFKKFIPYYKNYKGLLALDLFCACFTVLCELALPVIARNITDTGINNPAQLTIVYIAKIAVFYVILRLLDSAANYYMEAGGHIMGTKMETDMRRDLFSHLQTLSFTYYDNTKVGQLMSRITSDLFDIAEFSHHCPEQYLIASLKFIGSFIYLASINIKLTLIMFVPIPLLIVVSSKFKKRMRNSFKNRRHELGEINAQVEDTLLGIRVVKSFANEDVERKKFHKNNQTFFKVKRESYYSMAGFHTTVRLFDGLMYILVVCAGAVFIMKKQIFPADLTAYLLMVSTLLGSIRQIVQFSEQLQNGITGIERFVEIMEVKPEIESEEGLKEAESLEGHVEFKDVSFAYSDEGREILHGINIDIEKGQNVAIVGPSGGGKTTICNLIPRFYQIREGEITIDGTDVREFTLASLRENIGVVQQDVYLFSGTIKENIAYGRQDASDEDIIAAAKKAGAHNFISELENSYDTYVGERGIKLSGGQKQRISIARVFLKNPPVLILDEATSALDNESEKLIQQSLEELSKGRTTLTIAHRLTTIKNADKIIVLTRNGIEEQGTHAELIQKGGLYANMYEMYSV